MMINVYLNLLEERGCSGRVTDISRSHVTKLNIKVDDW